LTTRPGKRSQTFWIVTLNEAIRRARYGRCISVTQLSRNIALALTFKPAFRDPREVIIAIDIDAHCASRLTDDYSPIQAHLRFSFLFTPGSGSSQRLIEQPPDSLRSTLPCWPIHASIAGTPLIAQNRYTVVTAGRERHEEAGTLAALKADRAPPPPKPANRD
jgi:hypothetical protein